MPGVYSPIPSARRSVPTAILPRECFRASWSRAIVDALARGDPRARLAVAAGDRLPGRRHARHYGLRRPPRAPRRSFPAGPGWKPPSKPRPATSRRKRRGHGRKRGIDRVSLGVQSFVERKSAAPAASIPPRRRRRNRHAPRRRHRQRQHRPDRGPLRANRSRLARLARLDRAPGPRTSPSTCWRSTTTAASAKRCCSAACATAPPMRPATMPTAEFYEMAVERLAATWHSALRDFQLRAPRLGIAPQPEILDARALRGLRRRRPFLRRPRAPAESRNRSKNISNTLLRPGPRARRARGRPKMSASSSACAWPPASGPTPAEWQRFAAPIRRFLDDGLLESAGGTLRLTSRGVHAFQRSLPGVSLTVMIDLRSDTVTKPTPAMRHAMAEAEVGDDVYGEDPTVNRLERRAAEIAGKEAALFVPTGTMGNTIAVKLHTEHGQEVICRFPRPRARLRTFHGRLVLRLRHPRHPHRRRHSFAGTRSAASSSPSILTPRPPAWWRSRTPTICAAAPFTRMRPIREICEGAHERGVKVHMDGARIFNAAAALGTAGARNRRPRRHRDVLPFESPGRARRLPAGRPRRPDRQGPPLSQAAGRRHAAGGRAGRRRAWSRSKNRRKKLCRRSRQRPLPGRRPGAHFPAFTSIRKRSQTNIVVFDVAGYRQDPRRHQRGAARARRAPERHQRSPAARGDPLRRRPRSLRPGARGRSRRRFIPTKRPAHYCPAKAARYGMHDENTLDSP